MEYEIQYARLATTEKLPDRFLNAQVKSSSDLAKSSMGKVISLIEILTPWFPTAQIGQTIINIFFQKYYEGGSTSDLVNFEEALKKVNESLAQITQNGETDWIGNLNGILGVIVENKLHIAQTGKAEAYIFRDGKVNHLTFGLAQNGAEPHPLKTFSNITSGELKSLDKILIGNPELYQHLSIENIRQIITLNTPDEAILQIARILKKKRVNTVNVLIINLLSIEELAKQPVEDEEETVYLDRPLESIWAGAARVWNEIFSPILKFLGKGSKKVGGQTVSFTKNYLAKLSEKKKAQEPLRKKDLFDKEFMQENREEGLLKDEEIQYSPELNVHYYEEKKKADENKFSKFLNTIWRNFKKAFNFIIGLAKNRKTRAYFFIGLAIIILIILGLFINARRHRNQTQFNLTGAQSILKDAESANDQAKAAILSNDTEKAKQLLAEAISKAQQIENFPVVGQDAKNLLASAYADLDKLTSTTRFSSLNPLISIDDNVVASFVANNQGYLISKSDIYRGLISGGKPEKVASVPKNSGDFQFGVVMGKNIFLYTSSQKIFEYATDTGKIDLAKTNFDKWETANACASYGGNIYLLDGIIGQIYKHALSSDTFGASVTYINSPSIDIKNSDSLAIDGDVYVLKDSDVLKFTKGKLQDFGLKDTPTPWSKIEKPIKIYTDGDTPSLYVLDGGQKRILEYDKDGHFIHQYALPDSFQDLHDFVVSPKAKKIWVVNKNALYEINI